MVRSASIEAGCRYVPQRASHQSPVLETQRTVVIDAVYEANSDLGVVVGHEDDIKELIAVRVELPQARVDGHQRLCERTDRYASRARMLRRERSTTQTLRHCSTAFFQLSFFFLKKHQGITTAL